MRTFSYETNEIIRRVEIYLNDEHIEKFFMESSEIFLRILVTKSLSDIIFYNNVQEREA